MCLKIKSKIWGHSWHSVVEHLYSVHETLALEKGKRERLEREMTSTPGSAAILTAGSQQWQSTHARAPSATASCVPAPAMLARQPAAGAAQGTAHSPEHHYNSYKSHVYCMSPALICKTPIQITNVQSQMNLSLQPFLPSSKQWGCPPKPTGAVPGPLVFTDSHAMGLTCAVAA